MERMKLGEVEVSAVCLGTMTYGNQTAPEDAFAQMDRARDAGVTFLDMAEMYPVNPIRAETVGRTEEIVGDWLAARGNRDKVQVATKVSGHSRAVRDNEGYSGAIIRRTVDASLRRLKTDFIDLYQLHTPMRAHYHFRQNWGFKPDTQGSGAVRAHMEDVLSAMSDIMAAGKVRAFGVSNETAWGTANWLATAARMGGPRVVSIQNEYSLLDRLYDTDLAELGVMEGVTLLAFSPLAAGLLTGKYADGVPEGSRVAVDTATGGSGDLGGRLTQPAAAAVAAYHDLAAEHGVDPVHMAIAFTRQRPFPCIPILGATSSDQLAHLLAGLDLRLDDRVMSGIHRIHRQYPLPY